MPVSVEYTNVSFKCICERMYVFSTSNSSDVHRYMVWFSYDIDDVYDVCNHMVYMLRYFPDFFENNFNVDVGDVCCVSSLLDGKDPAKYAMRKKNISSFDFVVQKNSCVSLRISNWLERLKNLDDSVLCGSTD